jgi:two-component system NtrC family sensor kinase
MSATADQELAELRRAYEEMRSERDAALSELQTRTAALGRRDSEYGERIQHQSATIDVLKAMSASPGDPQPVFELITRRAQELCNATTAGLFEYDGKLVHLRSAIGGRDPSTIAKYAAAFPMAPARGSITCRAILDEKMVHISDMDAQPELLQVVRDLDIKSNIALPLMHNGSVIGAIALNSNKFGGFTDSQIELLETFAEQAVLAISSAETYRALQGRTADLQEALEQQTATAEVLQVINASPGNLAPVFDAMLERAMRLSGAAFGALYSYDGESVDFLAHHGVPDAFVEYRAKNPLILRPSGSVAQLIATKRPVQVADYRELDAYKNGHPSARALGDLGGARTVLWVPLLNDKAVTGWMIIYRQEVRPFSDKQIALLENFSAQAVIAMENARLMNEQREALEQQTATAEVLQVINTSPGDLGPVFDVIGAKAIKLCDAAFGAIMLPDGDRFRAVGLGCVPEAYADYCRTSPDYGRPTPGTLPGRMLAGEDVVHVRDVADAAAYPFNRPVANALVELGGGRTLLGVALRKDGELWGMITIFRQEVRSFSNRQIELLRGFAAQAVIAMENARLLNEVRQRQEELRITFENMGDGVAMFDETQRLVAWNSKFQEIYDLPDTLLNQHRTYEEYLRFLADRGDFGSGVDTSEQINDLVATTGQPYGYERTRPDGRVIEIRRNPVPDGGFVLIFSDITERKRSEVEIRAARDAAEAAYRDLKAAQASLIQAEKMASLGQLTAGIAHEIKNPLNFVNNFATLSVDLLDELKQTAAPGLALLDDARRAEVDELTSTLVSNLDKINEHGRRADGIVRGMLEHSRGSSGERREVELNTLVDEALNLAYHGARAQDQSFSVTLQREFGEGIAPITLAPQDVTRVLLNLFSNGFYAARERQRTEAMPGFEPIVTVSIRDLDGAVEIRVRDNGIGIPAEIRDRLFQPFFTTKPPGEGTGLGLSMSYDIITQQHGGSISVDSIVGEYSEFTVRLPRSS